MLSKANWKEIALADIDGLIAMSNRVAKRKDSLIDADSIEDFENGKVNIVIGGELLGFPGYAKLREVLVGRIVRDLEGNF